MANFVNRCCLPLFAVAIFALPANGASFTVEISYLPDVVVNADHSNRKETVLPPPTTGISVYNLRNPGSYSNKFDAQGRVSYSGLPAGIYSIITTVSDTAVWNEKRARPFPSIRMGVIFVDLRKGGSKHIKIVADSLPFVYLSRPQQRDLEPDLLGLFCQEDFEKRPRFSAEHAKRFHADMVRAMTHASSDLYEEIFATVRTKEYVEEARKVIASGLPALDTRRALLAIGWKLLRKAGKMKMPSAQRVQYRDRVHHDIRRMNHLNYFYITKIAAEEVLTGFAATFAAQESTCAP